MEDIILKRGLLLEDLKCCGNCKHRDSTYNKGDVIEWCELRHILSSWLKCKEWEFDYTVSADRLEGF